MTFMHFCSLVPEWVTADAGPAQFTCLLPAAGENVPTIELSEIFRAWTRNPLNSLPAVDPSSTVTSSPEATVVFFTYK